MRPDARFICDGEFDMRPECLDPRQYAIGREYCPGCGCKPCRRAPSDWPKVFAVVGFGLLCGWIILGWLL